MVMDAVVVPISGPATSTPTPARTIPIRAVPAGTIPTGSIANNVSTSNVDIVANVDVVVTDARSVRPPGTAATARSVVRSGPIAATTGTISIDNRPVAASTWPISIDHWPVATATGTDARSGAIAPDAGKIPTGSRAIERSW
jgi:hypothetical protein